MVWHHTTFPCVRKIGESVVSGADHHAALVCSRIGDDRASGRESSKLSIGQRRPSRAELAEARAAELRAAIAANSNSREEKDRVRASTGSNILENTSKKMADCLDGFDERLSSKCSGSKMAMAETRAKELAEAMRQQQVKKSFLLLNKECGQVKSNQPFCDSQLLPQEERDARRSISQSYSLQPPFADSLVQDSRAKQSGCGDTRACDKMRGQRCLADCEHNGNVRREPSDYEMASSISISRQRGGPARSLSEFHPPFGTTLSAGRSEHRATTEDAAPVCIPGQGCDARVSDGDGASFPLYRLNDKELSTRSLQALSLSLTACLLH